MSVAIIFGRGLSMNQFNQTDHLTLDQEWLELIQEARRLGLTIEEVQQFLKSQHIDSPLHSNSNHLQTPIKILIST